MQLGSALRKLGNFEPKPFKKVSRSKRQKREGKLHKAIAVGSRGQKKEKKRACRMLPFRDVIRAIRNTEREEKQKEEEGEGEERWGIE